ncbi:MAG: 16S rRNA (guanine(527)-N(7))-methyltransferase RsmG [Dongiaceae bacterium]
MTPEAFAATVNVSRETLSRFRNYADLLVKWQAKINLVGADSLPDLWRRHMLDSAQLMAFLPPSVSMVADIGSGAGFPGLVLALLGVPQVHLIESDTRKCAFLGEAARALGLVVGRNPVIHRARVENMKDLRVGAVIARACAPLSKLIGYSEPLGPVCLFLKGAHVAEELTEAKKTWRMRIERFPSLSDPSGTILRISQVARARR